MDTPAKQQYPIKPDNMIPYKAAIARGILLVFIPIGFLTRTKGIVPFHNKVSFA